MPVKSRIWKSSWRGAYAADSSRCERPWGAAISALLATVLSVASLSAQAPATQELSLQEAVRVALEKNPTVKASVACERAVHEGIAEARAARFPRLDFSEGFTRGNNPVYVFGGLLTERQFNANDFAVNFLNTPPPLDIFHTQFSAALPLYDAGQTGRRIKDAKLNAQGAGEAGRRTRQEVIFGVVKAYTNELLATENVRVAEAAVKAAQSDLERAQARKEQGQAGTRLSAMPRTCRFSPTR